MWARWVLRYHAQVPRLKGRLYELLRKCEVSAFAARLRSGRAGLAAVEAHRPFFFLFFFGEIKGGLRATCKPREVRACNNKVLRDGKQASEAPADAVRSERRIVARWIRWCLPDTIHCVQSIREDFQRKKSYQRQKEGKKSLKKLAVRNSENE